MKRELRDFFLALTIAFGLMGTVAARAGGDSLAAVRAALSAANGPPPPTQPVLPPVSPSAPVSPEVTPKATASSCGANFLSLAGRLAERAKADPKLDPKPIAANLPEIPRKYFDHTPDHGWKKWLHAYRQKLQDWLQIRNEHPYPIVALEDTVKSAWWAKQAFPGGHPANAAEAPAKPKAPAAHGHARGGDDEGDDDETGQPFNKSAVMTDLNQFIATVKSFEPDMQGIFDEAIDNEVRIIALQAMPSRSVPEDIELNQRLRDRKGVGDRIADRVQSQSQLISRIALYRDALKREGQLHPGVALPADYQGFVASSDQLYTLVGAHHSIRDEFQPPIWAYQKLRWMQLGIELNAWIRSDKFFLQKFIPEDKWQEFLKFVDGFSASEKRVLGLTNVNEVATSWRKGRLASLIGVVTTMSGGVVAGGVQLFHWLIAEATSQTDCAQKNSDKDYENCAYLYLRGKFPNDFIDGRASFTRYFADDSTITNPELKKAVQELAQRRAQVVAERNADSQFRDQLNGQLAQATIGTAQWLDQTLYHSTPEEFRDRMLNADPQKGYLMFKYPQLYNDAAMLQKITTIIDEKDKNARKTELDELAKIPAAAALARDLTSLLKKHEGPPPKPGAHPGQHDGNNGDDGNGPPDDGDDDGGH